MAKAYIVAHAEIKDEQVVVTRVGIYSASPESLSQDLNGLSMLVTTCEAPTYGEAQNLAELYLKRVKEYNKALKFILENRGA